MSSRCVPRLGGIPLELDFGDVARSIQPETVHIRSLAGEDRLRVLEQSYKYPPEAARE